jgi:heme o synthase
MTIRQKIRALYSLTKPGVLYGNALSAIAGFLFGAHGHPELSTLVAASVGIALVIGSACVINNYLDQDIDARMSRTKKRALITGAVTGREAVILGVLLGVIGFGLLFAFTNTPTVWVGAIGYIDYLVLYGMWSKRQSVHGTLVGAISGAAPILGGYTAATGQIDTAGLLVFLAIFLWQMPEFYSIAIFRAKEYAAAGVPVITVVKGIPHTVREIFAYTAAFVATTLALTFIGATGWTYSIIMAGLGAYWLRLAIAGLRAPDQIAWSRRMFRWSLIILLAFCGLVSFDAYLP